ncbi:MAG: DUF1566 domain-containing protein [Desulfobulbaceae bacterium]|nr:DUF1566 domain-containing protein [Desulfobulbaceae bacterium]
MGKIFFRCSLLLFGLLEGLAWGAPPYALAAETTLPPLTPPPIALPRTGQISTYDQTGSIIDFHGSGQDGEYQRGTVWPEPRFIINPDGTVSDSLTGLMWLKNGNCFGDLPWPAAVKIVPEFNQGKAMCPGARTDYQDWFLPDLNQLASLIDAQAEIPIDQLKLAGFTDLQSTLYWSATAYKGSLNAWGVDFRNGAIDLRNKLDRHMLLLVRKESPQTSVTGKNNITTKPSVTEGPKQQAQTLSRFLDNGDGTTTDTMTGLMWLQDASCLSKLDWQSSLTTMKVLSNSQISSNCPPSTRKYTDWSMPNVIELRSLIDYDVDYPALPTGHHFTRIGQGGYWSSTSVAPTPGQAFIIDLNSGAMLPSLKTEQHHVLAVRQVSPPTGHPRKEVEKSGDLGVTAEYVLPLDPEMPNEISWPPLPRFFNNGDGTSIDAITGITWLTDANCFGKRSWKEAAETLKKFNARTKGFTCGNYEGGIVDWQLPTLAELRELIHTHEGNNAEWLMQQGLKNVQANTIYWSATETPINLYFADAISLKTGKEGNYPKSLKFIVWPKSNPPKDDEQSPLLHMTANTIDARLNLSEQDPLALSVYLHPFGMRIPADFWFWYDTPDEKNLWLTHIRTWSAKATPVYQGPTFNLKNYEIFRSLPGLAPGVYEFHFAIDTNANGIFDEPRYETSITVVVGDEQSVKDKQ